MPLNGNPCETHASHSMMDLDERVTALEGAPPGSASWGSIGGSISAQTDLANALAGKQASLGFTPVPNTRTVAGKTLSADVSLAKADVGLGNVDNTSDAAKPISTATQTALDGKQAAGSYASATHNHDASYAAVGHNHDAAYEAKDAAIQAHIQAAHAPSNAQKNSDITKAEIEAKLTGEISTHTHAGGSDPFIFKGATAADISTAANTTPVNVTGLVFSFIANSKYAIEIFGAIKAAAATTGAGLQFDTSAAVTRVRGTFFHQLANTGTLSGGSTIADDASVGVSSGIPSTNTDTPFYWAGSLITGANAGTAQLRLRSETTAVVTLSADTLMRVQKLV